MMQALTDRLYALKDLTEKTNNVLSEKYNVTSCHMPIAGLNMVCNQVIIMIELVGYYYQRFEIPPGVILETSYSKYPEQYERIHCLLNTSLVSVMSVFESCIRKGAESISHTFGNPPSTMINAVQKSRKLSWISLDDELVWDGIISIRNCLVHNNGEAQRAIKFQLPDGTAFECARGVKPSVSWNHYLGCIEWTVRSFAVLCEEVLKAHVSKFDFRPQGYSYLTSQANGAWEALSQPPNGD